MAPTRVRMQYAQPRYYVRYDSLCILCRYWNSPLLGAAPQNRTHRLALSHIVAGSLQRFRNYSASGIIAVHRKVLSTSMNCGFSRRPSLTPAEYIGSLELAHTLAARISNRIWLDGRRNRVASRAIADQGVKSSHVIPANNVAYAPSETIGAGIVSASVAETRIQGCPTIASGGCPAPLFGEYRKYT